MAQHGLDLVTRHARQQAGGNGHQRRVFERPRGKGIGLAFVNAHLGHANARTFGQALHRLHDPGFIGRARLGDQLQTRRPFGHLLAHQQRDDGPGKADEQREHHQRPVIHAIGRQIAVQPKNRRNDAQHQHDGQVGEQKQNDAFHGIPSQGRCMHFMKTMQTACTWGRLLVVASAAGRARSPEM